MWLNTKMKYHNTTMNNLDLTYRREYPCRKVFKNSMCKGRGFFKWCGFFFGNSHGVGKNPFKAYSQFPMPVIGITRQGCHFALGACWVETNIATQILYHYSCARGSFLNLSDFYSFFGAYLPCTQADIFIKSQD